MVSTRVYVQSRLGALSSSDGRHKAASKQPACSLSMWNALFALLAPGGGRGRLSILIFHRVHAKPDPMFPEELDAHRFEQQIAWLAQWFNILPLAEGIERLKRKSLPPRALSITFDDGYANNYTVALPILQRHRIAATIFVATRYLDGGCMWNDLVIEAARETLKSELDLRWLGLDHVPVASIEQRRCAVESVIGKLKYQRSELRAESALRFVEAAHATVPSDLMLTTAQVKGLHRAGSCLGAHTATHPILARLDAARARAEIETGKADLEALIGERVALFAYPNGKPGVDYVSAHVDMVRQAGFSAAVSTAWGVSHSASDPFQLPRFTPWDRTKHKYAMRLAQNFLRVA